jgi:1,4-dihydroxy-2-naphthoate octaprenyltransferase
MAKIKILFFESRPQFLILSVVLSFLGSSIAWYNGYFNPLLAVLAAAGLSLAHASCNVLNDYFDYQSGVDLKTERTPFSGGSGVLPAGLLRPEEVLRLGVACFLLIIPIGIYFVLARGWWLLPLLGAAALCIILYTPFLLKTRYPEWAAGLGLGILPILGTYYIQSGDYTLSALVASVPSGILVYNLLMLNEFPDVQADRTAGKKTLPIIAGKKKAAVVYAAMTALVYLWIIGGIIAGMIPVFSLLVLLTLPFAIRAITGALKADDRASLISAMANNVKIVMLVQLLMGTGYILGRLL